MTDRALHFLLVTISECCTLCSCDGRMQIVIAKYQLITLTRFLPALGISASDVRDHSPTFDSPAILMEFDISYRFGHDMIPDSISASHTDSRRTLQRRTRFWR